MKLYDSALAPNPRRVRIYLAEKGLSVPLVPVDLAARAARTPEFKKKNPVGGIPVLELDDGSCIAESVAICRYFEALHPNPPLFGRTAKDQAVVEMWLRRVELNLMVPVGMVWIHGHPLTAKLVKQIPEAAEQNRVRSAIGYKLLDDQLARAPFISGPAYTMADIVALATIDFAVERVGVPYDETLGHLRRWHETVAARPSARA